MSVSVEERVRNIICDQLAVEPEKVSLTTELSGRTAPQLIAAYFSDADTEGHNFGPDSPQTDSAIAHVDSVVGAIEAVIANGGTIVQTMGGDAPEITARFRDPGGNVIGLYQEPVPQTESP